MLSTYAYPRYAFRRPAELGLPAESGHLALGAPLPVVVVGAGPVGLALAIDLAQQGLPVVLLDDDDTVSVGSRGLCYAKRTLEILDRLGCGDAVVAKGVTWNVGRTFHREAEVFRFELLPESGHRRPGMLNLQQYHLEQLLVERAQALPAIDLRWKSRVVAIEPGAEVVRIEVDTPAGRYPLQASWLVAADGARSPTRRMLRLEVEGQVFQDRFLIADVVMSQPLFADGAAERWFWFDPPFHPGQSVLLHREADEVWRIDFQLGWDADPELERQPERVLPRIRAMLGPEREFELEWVSVYTFQCRRMQRFRHGRVLFAGDAAHQLSPFGARGANSGIQDADNLAWKLALVLRGQASESLLDSYSQERVLAADDNLLNSTRSTDFITPKTEVSRDFRNAVLGLAREHALARALVNSGRLSLPTPLQGSALNTPDRDAFTGAMQPGTAMADAPVRKVRNVRNEHHADGDGWLLAHTGGRFVLVLFALTRSLLDEPTRLALRKIGGAEPAVHILVVANVNTEPPAECAPGVEWVIDIEGLAARRFDARDGTAYLLRPDQHVVARWRRLEAREVMAALSRATGRTGSRRNLEPGGPGPAPEPGVELVRGAGNDQEQSPARPQADRHAQGASAMTSLLSQPNFHRAGKPAPNAYAHGDAFYERLIATHRGLSDADSRVLNARLVLLLANHIGELGILEQALAAAREGMGADSQGQELAA